MTIQIRVWTFQEIKNNLIQTLQISIYPLLDLKKEILLVD